MRPMNENEILLYDILKNNKEARMSNYEACRQFYKRMFNIDLPNLKGMPTIWTIERAIRTLKDTYPKDLTDEEERAVKSIEEDKFKENALDKNKPIKPQQMNLLYPWEDSL